MIHHLRPLILTWVLSFMILFLSVEGFTLLEKPKSPTSTRMDTSLSIPIHKIRSGSTTRETVVRAWPSNRDPKGMPADYPLAVARIGFTVAATVLTWYAHASKRCGPVMASSAVTLLSSLTAPGLGQAAMTGTFAGMSGTGIIPTLPYALGVGALVSFLFEFFIHYFNAFLGVGGRLGSVAFIGVNAIAAIQRIPAIRGTASLSALQSAPLLVPVAFGALGSVATIALREASDDSAAADPVRAAALVGLLASMLVGVAGFTDFGALAVYGGAFTGMSLPSRLLYGVLPGKPSSKSKELNLSPLVLLSGFAVAGALGGLLHGASLGFEWFGAPGGWGGKAGTCSFLGVLIFRAFSKLIGL